MKTKTLSSLLGLAATALAFGEDYSAKQALPAPTSDSRWSFGASASLLFGVEAEFSRFGNWTSPYALQGPGPGLDRLYDDGFNQLDSSGNAGGSTWNWGYQNVPQYDSAGTGTIDLSVYQSARNASDDASDDPHLGFSLHARYDMGEFSAIGANSNARWGWQFGFAYQNIGIDSNSNLLADVTRSTDRFDLNGVIPPGAPYSGSFSGPGALLGSSPVSSSVSTLAGGALVSGSRDLDANLFNLSAGPYLEWAVTPNFFTFVEGGLNLGIIDGDYSFNSITSIAGVSDQTTIGRDSETDILLGFYLGAGVRYQLNEQWSILSDVRYQYLSSFDLSAAGSRASLDFDTAFSVNIGAIFQF